MFRPLLLIFVISSISIASSFYDNPEQDPLPPGPDSAEELHRKWDFEWGFSGISTFAHLKHVKSLSDRDTAFDIGIIGAPFDTAVSYRPGARFGPRAIRAASARQTSFRGFNPRRGLNPFAAQYTILDCGDIPITPFDNALAVQQMSEAFLELGSRPPALIHSTNPKPKLLTLGGDHSIALPALRALNKIYGGPVAVLHFDAHLDTWHPAKYPSAWPSAQSDFTHGSMFWIASNEGLILNGSSAHAGLRSRLTGWDDYEDDERQGFLRISTDDIDEMGTAGIINAILERIGTEIPTYLSLDIDVLDPGLCPGTGTPEAGGWTSREVIRILRGLESLNVVGADIVEVAPAYDGRGEQTALVAAQVGYEILTSWVGRGMAEMEKADSEGKTENGRDEL
ncbi:hypothetical protein OEA41_003130 [Lepraria neglecta]|uniref:Agmatinase n=1 Tax=Lepraria neglecta TaxID=209136 RepID=A0AAD9Z435_9LECA|nr:hypothetical protein OEA41_003130 [Lepraria neglecta]